MIKAIGKGLRKPIKMLLTFISPKLETIINYRYSFGEWIDWKKPQDLNAYVNILKVTDYYNNPEVTMCVDKYRVREWLEKNWDGDNLCPDLYGVYSSLEEIDWGQLPNRVVLKCNHSCGANLIIKDRSKMDVIDAEQKLRKWMRHDYWRQGEVQYKYIKKCIIAEEYLGEGEDLLSFKFYCFHGEPRLLYVSLDEDRYVDFYDLSFNKLPYTLENHEHYPNEIRKPENFYYMVDIARRLSSHFPFVRVDLFHSYGRVYLSELTFVPTGGYMRFDTQGVLKDLTKWI